MIPAERLAANVRRGGAEECWPWVGRSRVREYGSLSRGARADGMVLAHRLAWELEHGPIPEGLCVLHSCDNPPCCNPAHLFLGTQADNMADMARKGRAARQRLTVSDVHAIRDTYNAGGTTQRALALKFGVTQTHVWRIVNGRVPHVAA